MMFDGFLFYFVCYDLVLQNFKRWSSFTKLQKVAPSIILFTKMNINMEIENQEEEEKEMEEEEEREVWNYWQ